MFRHLIQRYRAYQQAGCDALASRSQVIDSPHGSIEYAVQGTGPAVLVSHGSFGGFDLGLLAISFLQDIQAKFIVPSRFGYLRTSIPLDAAPAAQARAFAGLLDSLGIDTACLIGFSAGGLAALQFALQYPERCWGVIMVSAVSQRSVPGPLIRLLVEHVLTNEFLGWLLTTYFPRLVAQSTGDDYTSVAGDPLLKKTVLNLAAPTLAGQRRAGLLNDLHQAAIMADYPFEQIAVPLLVIHGTTDPFVPFETAHYLAAKVKGAKLLPIEHGGHLSFLIHPEKSRHAVLEFLETYSPG